MRFMQALQAAAQLRHCALSAGGRLWPRHSAMAESQSMQAEAQASHDAWVNAPAAANANAVVATVVRPTKTQGTHVFVRVGRTAVGARFVRSCAAPQPNALHRAMRRDDGARSAVAATLRWPRGLLGHRCVLVRSLAVAADGSAVVASSPTVLLQF